jgi:hypothetical protein
VYSFRNLLVVLEIFEIIVINCLAWIVIREGIQVNSLNCHEVINIIKDTWHRWIYPLPTPGRRCQNSDDNTSCHGPSLFVFLHLLRSYIRLFVLKILLTGIAALCLWRISLKKSNVLVRSLNTLPFFFLFSA